MPRPPKEPREYVYKCARCGAKTDLRKYDENHPAVKRMIKDGTCFHCAYWTRFLERKQRKYEVVDGKVYMFGKTYFAIGKEPTKTRHIYHLEKDVRRMPKSFAVATAPPDFDIPDTGVFISKKAYRSLVSRIDFQCRAIGCYDRYNCMLYHPEVMEPDGPWNEIPDWHKAGDEQCPSFLDRETNQSTQ